MGTRPGRRWRLATGTLLLFLSSFLFTGSPHTADASTTITFTDFANISNLVLSGTTAGMGNPVTRPDGKKVLRMTNERGQGGGAFLNQQIPLQDTTGTFKASFSTAFDFQMTNPRGISDENGQGADGIVFVIQTQTNQYGGIGGGLGYVGIPNSVGIEFDTWDNGGPDNYSGNHVAVLANGSLNELAFANVAEGVMKNGAIWHAWIDYNGDTKLLEVRVTQSATRPASPLLSYTIDLPAILGQPNAYVGFVGATGAASNNQDILSWQFTNIYNPITNICSVPNGLTWLAPLSAATPANIGANVPLHIRFQYNSCTLDESVSAIILDSTGDVATGYTYGGGITFDAATGTYDIEFVPSDYGAGPGAQLTIYVYFADTLAGSAQANVQ